MKLLIVDDEAGIREGLILLLQTFCPEVTEIEEASSVQEGIDKINSFHPDILFTDVEMGDGTGFDLLSQIEKYSFPVIFITAHNKYAVNAFKFCAIDFLVKPIDPEELIEAMNKVKNQLMSSDLSRQFDLLLQTIKNQSQTDKKIVLRDSKTVYFVKITDIYHCEAAGSYTDFFLADGSKITVSKPLKEYEQLLEHDGFIRTHHSHLINVKHILKLDKTDGGSLILENGKSVPISQRKWDQVLKLLDI